MTPPVILSEDERARYARDGFLVVDHPVVGANELAEVRGLLLDLFDRFDRLPPEHAYDLGDVKHHDGPQQIPEINHTIELEPRLAGTVAFARVRAVAREVLGRNARCVYDHAICKPPNGDAAIEWHQDLAYNPTADLNGQAHIWLALQDVTEANGCLQFIPDADHALLPHHRRGGSVHAHALVADGVDPRRAVACPVTAGMVTIHRLTTPHSSGPNTTDVPRLAWILQFRGRGPARPTARIRAAVGRLERTLRR